MKLSLCITNYNRTTLLEESFKEVLNDERIDEIIICDDNSDMPTCRFLYFLHKSHPKIQVTFHKENVGMYENKKRAIELAKNEWCILFDSDNIITPSYISAFEKWCGADVRIKGTHVIYCPDFAFPKFDYRVYSRHYFGRLNIKNFIRESMFECLLNTCNYVVERSAYLRIWEDMPDIKAADSIYFIYLWIKSGNSIFVVPDMLYNHRVHTGSGFMEDVNENMRKAALVKNLILNL